MILSWPLKFWTARDFVPRTLNGYLSPLQKGPLTGIFDLFSFWCDDEGGHVTFCGGFHNPQSSQKNTLSSRKCNGTKIRVDSIIRNELNTKIPDNHWTSGRRSVPESNSQKGRSLLTLFLISCSGFSQILQETAGRSLPSQDITSL